MNKRLIKEECYLDMLEDEINSVDAVLNYIDKLKEKKGVFDDEVIQKDLIHSYFDLELALASLCILLRKMSENMFIHIDEEIRRDINSIIHSNKFEYHDHEKIYVYSKKGKEPIELSRLMQFARSIL
ncbi:MULTISPECIES: hypothetical protein [unclassified Thomasclavelia]|uniref:Uncharacterized protein n=1 Tax=Candidatus Erysipelatoclostridium merdavium TaxID=2838566 RepID=A0A9D2BMZ6_9FIRM|nr:MULTISPECIES: hypothetical protein [unclassified Thomasclavelia]OUP75347.1 hypothetical protein B5F09_09300 [Erysipelatoclostridium sp. An173]OUQ08506.1 hypothetical protein B5E92_03585 [Erysipelatoclostridium sp. An15]HIX81973.1 hypothetical protein [Candidatus Erysipelatoclostridium merdavium]